MSRNPVIEVTFNIKDIPDEMRNALDTAIRNGVIDWDTLRTVLHLEPTSPMMLNSGTIYSTPGQIDMTFDGRIRKGL